LSPEKIARGRKRDEHATSGREYVKVTRRKTLDLLSLKRKEGNNGGEKRKITAPSTIETRFIEGVCFHSNKEKKEGGKSRFSLRRRERKRTSVMS